MGEKSCIKSRFYVSYRYAAKRNRGMGLVPYRVRISRKGQFGFIVTFEYHGPGTIIVSKVRAYATIRAASAVYNGG